MAHEFYDTIAALSTPAGESGIAVVRMVGERTFEILRAMFATTHHGDPPAQLDHHRIYHGYLHDRSGETIDEVMCAVMHAPDTYTGQDTVEISCHGNALVVGRILDAIFSHGARSAQAGEFTKRAFLNGKIDLIQAEAVADLIHARSELQRQVAQRQLAGGLSDRIHALAGELLELLGHIEVNIDFIEEGLETLDYAASIAMLERHRLELDRLLGSAAFSKPFREGYRVAIVGPVNAGKSSLFNRMVGENRAIVTEIPGTTRDVIREPIILEGLVFVLHDTAGLRGTRDRVESIGIDLAETAASHADIVVFVIDSSEPAAVGLSERLEKLDVERSVVVMNKTDLPPHDRAWQGERTTLRCVRASAQTGDGLDALKGVLVEYVGRDGLSWIARERIVLNSRLISILEQARQRVDVLKENLARREPLEILALDAREVLQLYETATGKRYSDDLLDTIFSRFCIGK